MKTFIFTSLAISCLWASVAAVPTPPSSEESKKGELLERNTGGIYICTDQYFKGTCGWKAQPLNTCIHLDPPWYKTISSFGPDQGIVCSWYSDYDCQSLLESNIRYPGVADMDQWNKCGRSVDGGALEARCHGNQMGSFLCKAG
ncbi:hypothetical protein IQ06DRAFT_334638 [Phaeosphaeriaceae sp. SRC1lsM3a]|nr:hypothetical protein IQ06DRAFT_334638 [Stagonospora sp. SRC1lsM3a]